MTISRSAGSKRTTKHSTNNKQSHKKQIIWNQQSNLVKSPKRMMNISCSVIITGMCRAEPQSLLPKPPIASSEIFDAGDDYDEDPHIDDDGDDDEKYEWHVHR